MFYKCIIDDFQTVMFNHITILIFKNYFFIVLNLFELYKLLLEVCRNDYFISAQTEITKKRIFRALVKKQKKSKCFLCASNVSCK